MESFIGQISKYVADLCTTTSGEDKFRRAAIDIAFSPHSFTFTISRHFEKVFFAFMSSSTRINAHILVVQYGNSRTVSLLWFAVPWGLIVPSFLGYDLGMRLAIQYGAVYWIQ